MLPGQRMGAGRARALVAAAAGAGLARAGVGYPRWYLARWHYLPEGYLSSRSVGAYDRAVRNLYNAGLERRAHQSVVAALARERPRTILEVGCGPGRLLTAIQAALGAVELTGADLSPFMLAAAEERAGPGVRLLHADARDLPFEDGHFDAAIAAHVFGHVPAPVQAAMLGEAARVIRPGGLLCALDHAWHQAPANPHFTPTLEQRELGGLLRLRRWERVAVTQESQEL